jgi:hypothetical protein
MLQTLTMSLMLLSPGLTPEEEAKLAIEQTKIQIIINSKKQQPVLMQGTSGFPSQQAVIRESTTTQAIRPTQEIPLRQINQWHYPQSGEQLLAGNHWHQCSNCGRVIQHSEQGNPNHTCVCGQYNNVVQNSIMIPRPPTIQYRWQQSCNANGDCFFHLVPVR